MSLGVSVSASAALWLIGQGISASPSPAMQNAALRACGLDWEYSIRDVSAAELPSVLAALRGGAARGANVTIPHKRAVAAACDSLVGDAQLTGAVNTVIVDRRRLVGDNTDALGLEEALQHRDLWPSPGAAVVILGAGGAAAAAALALSRSAPASISLVARRQSAAEGLVAQLRPHIPTLRSAPWGTVAVDAASVLVNATPAGVGDLPVDVDALPSTCIVVDLRYRPRPVDLVAAAKSRGLRATDGLEMLLHQGMLSFQRWTGQSPPWDAARAALRSAVWAATA